MAHSMKAFGLILVAALALSAVAAASAGAQAAHLTAGANSGRIDITEHPNAESGIQRFETDFLSLRCDEFDAEINYAGGAGGSVKFTEETIEDLKYDECIFNGVSTSIVNFGACDYTFASSLWLNPAGHIRSYWGIEPEGCKITISEPIFGCVLTIEGSQLFENALTYTNVKTATKEELTIHASAEGIKYTANANCPNPGTFEDGVYEGTWTAKAFAAGNGQVDLTGVAT